MYFSPEFKIIISFILPGDFERTFLANGLGYDVLEIKKIKTRFHGKSIDNVVFFNNINIK